MSGPRGHFLYQSRERRAVCVATGTGIAPFVAMLRAGLGRDALLLHGVREATELYYAELIAAAARNMDQKAVASA